MHDIYVHGFTHGPIHGFTCFSMYSSIHGFIHGFMHGTKMNRQGCTAYGMEADMNDIFIHGCTHRAKERGHAVVRVIESAEACSRLVMRC